MKCLSFSLVFILVAMVTNQTEAAFLYQTSGSTVSYDFTGFDGTGDPTNWVTSNVASTSNWLGTGSGSATAGGKYSFGDTGSGSTFDGSLGFLPSGSQAINANWTVQNNTGLDIIDFTVGYTAEHWRSASGGRNNGWAVSYSIDGGLFVNLPALTYVAPNSIVTGAGPHGSVPLSTTVTGLSIANGSELTFRFFGDNGTGSGARQGVAIDDFFFQATAVPEPTSLALLGLCGVAATGYRRRRANR